MKCPYCNGDAMTQAKKATFQEYSSIRAYAFCLDCGYSEDFVPPEEDDWEKIYEDMNAIRKILKECHDRRSETT